MVLDNCENGMESLSNIQLLFRQLYRYACENDIVEKGYFVEIDREKPESLEVFLPKKKEIGYRIMQFLILIF